MTGATQVPSYDYVAYIDESGDPSVRRVKPLDSPGSSEWMTVSAVVVRAENEAQVTQWIQNISSQMHSPQMHGLHFRKLTPWRKKVLCEEIAKLPVRCFVVCSNKKNMRGWHNPFAAQVPSKNWFYCWMTRVLLERVTHFVSADSIQRFREVRRVKVVYSRAGGLSYPQMTAYYEWIRNKGRANNQFLNRGDLIYETLNPHLLEVRDDVTEPGLQLADAVASAFFKACDKYDTGGCDPSFAKLLTNRAGAVPDTKHGMIAGYGVKLLPSLRGAKLDADQEDIFRHFGYPNQWWDNKKRAPDPYAPNTF
jgi:hypothetical protein